MKIYLAGAISHDPDCEKWRDYLSIALPMHDFWNPLKQKGNCGGTNLREHFRSLQHSAFVNDDISYLAELRKTVCDVIIPGDLLGLLWCSMFS